MTLANATDPNDGALRALIERYRPEIKTFEGFYCNLHTFPELSGQEERTATTAAEHLNGLDFEVHTHIGGYGVAGVFRNGDGPTVLLRADMDALAQHVLKMKAGTVSVKSGRLLTAADAFDVRIYGHGGHGSAPLIGASIVLGCRALLAVKLLLGRWRWLPVVAFSLVIPPIPSPVCLT